MSIGRFRTYALTLLIVLTCLAAFLPYVMPYSWEFTTDDGGKYVRDAEGRYVRNIAYDYIGPGVWSSLLIVTLIVGKWNRKLYRLLILFPVAFGFWIGYAYFALHAWLFGFAP